MPDRLLKTLKHMLSLLLYVALSLWQQLVVISLQDSAYGGQPNARLCERAADACLFGLSCSGLLVVGDGAGGALLW